MFKILIMNPSEFPEVKSYPAIVKLLQNQVDMLFEDIRSMLQLPLHGPKGGCNFATANFICDVISGISVILYKPEEGLQNDRFKDLMKKYYPWNEEGFEPQQGIDIYKGMRNSITHRLGFALSQRGERPVTIAKSPCNIQQIEELEDLSKPFILKTIEVNEDGTHSISVLGLYRGLHKMLKKLFEDRNEMQKTNEFWENSFL